jgi:hypothetical protein
MFSTKQLNNVLKSCVDLNISLNTEVKFAYGQFAYGQFAYGLPNLIFQFEHRFAKCPSCPH